MKPNITLAERFDQSWRAWNRALDGLDDSAFESPNVYRQWNLKDIMGHVYCYVDLALRHCQSYIKRKKLASPRAPSYGYFNRREAARLRHVSAQQIRADLNSAYGKLIELLPSLTAADLRKSFPSQWSNSKGNTTLRGILREEANHIGNHAEDIRKWRKREHVG